MNTEITELKKLNVAFPDGVGRWFPVFMPLLAALGCARGLPSWMFMWLIAASIFAGAKWITVAGQWAALPCWRLAAYLFLWPGLNLEFCHVHTVRPRLREWLAAAAKIVLGGMLLSALRFLPCQHPLLIGWIGMIGIAFLLHFGVFHWLSIMWRAAGFNALPLMNNPLRATSLACFWGRRWNRAFSDLMTPHVFAPLARRCGSTVALMTVFLISGLLHELVISLPARGGFGLPTLYFAIQAAGLLMERSAVGRRFELGRGVRGWLFTAAVTAAPAYWLFHPIFQRNVILPMLQKIGAIQGAL